MIKYIISLVFLSSLSYAACVGPYCYDDTGAYVTNLHVSSITFADGSIVGAPSITTPAGSDTQIQFNSSNLFGASANLTYDGTTFNAFPVSQTKDLSIVAADGTTQIADFSRGNTPNDFTLYLDQVDSSFQVLNPSNHISFKVHPTGQVIVNDNGPSITSTLTPDPSAAFSVVSSTRGFLPPVGSTTTISNPATGLVIYSTNTSTLEFFNGSVWKQVSHN